MNPQQFSEALLALQDRATRLGQTRASQICCTIAEAIAQNMPGVDERLAQLHRQLLLVDVTHRLMRMECHSKMVVH
ncbi:MAG: hypothetical protein L6Q92_01140 [Phycisphaerae bacterium]|nr:hypothetical protein [Phycisphaerae bacterium]